MNKKKAILLEIVDYVNKNKIMPTRRYLQKKFNFKSVNSITQYIKSLEKENYLIKNSAGKLILDQSAIFYDLSLKKIKIINSNNLFAHIIIDKNKSYVGFKIHNNFFNYCKIFRNDILIIELKKELENNDIGLFIIDEKYRIMKYNYKDGFYILKDYEELLLNKIKIIGKVIMIERKL